jgi:hypothetical protein
MNFKNGPNPGRKKKPPWSIRKWALGAACQSGVKWAGACRHHWARHFFSQNELASRAGKTPFFFRIDFFPTSPRINQANLSSKLRSRAEETHMVFSDVRLVYVKPSFMCESKFVAQN